MFVFVYVVGNGLGMLLGNLCCSMGGKIIALLFFKLVFIKFAGFCNSLNTQCMTSSVCRLVG